MWIAILAVVLIVAAFAVVTVLKHRKPPIAVQTEKVARRNITETVVANGKIYPVVQVHISPEVSGEITKLPVKEGQFIHKGDLLLTINPDVYIAGLSQAKAGYESSLASKATAAANVEKAEADFKRNKELSDRRLLSDSDFIGFKVARDVAQAQLESANDQVNVAKAAVDNAQDLLDKTTIVSPLDGTITTLNSQLGERVLGTVQNAGTDIMIISDLSQIEARVDIGEMDVVLIQPGQKARLDVDSFKDKKFTGTVTAVANSSEGLNTSSGALSASSSSSQSATQFQVRIRVNETEAFRPGMSVTTEIETRSRTNTLAVPIASVTTRIVKSKTGSDPAKTNSTAAKSSSTNPIPASALAATDNGTNAAKGDKKMGDAQKPVEVVFVVEGSQVKTAPVKIGISDDNYWEITDGLKEGDEIVSGPYHAISHDLDDGKKIAKGTVVEADTTQP
jgi:HlyD family secretion protein